MYSTINGFRKMGWNYPALFPFVVSEADLSNLMTPSVTSEITPLNATSNLPTCSDGFYHDENGTGLCRPLCGEYNPKPLVFKVVDFFAACVGITSSVTIFVLAFTIQRESL